MTVNFGPTTNLAVTDTSQVGPNAATNIYSTTLAGPVTYPASGSTVYVAAILTFTAGVDAIMQATAAWDVSVAGGPLVGGGIVKLSLNSGTVTDNATGTFTSDFQRVNSQANLAVTAGTACQVTVEVDNPTLNTTVKNVSLRVELVKR